jgi:hypothetical protein
MMAAVPGAGRARRRLGHPGGAEVQGIEALGRDPGCQRHQSRGFGGLAWTRRQWVWFIGVGVVSECK